MPTPRLRFAPSPTGYLHVGGARTALFNWLYARRMGGVFVLRIEDTDVERSSADMVTGILDGMRWIGLDWDEGPEVGGDYGPYFQSQRLARYRELGEQLVRDGHAYYCYCGGDKGGSSQEGSGSAGGAQSTSYGETEPPAADDAAWDEGDTPRGESWTYDRRCSRLTPEEVAAREAAKMPRAIRFRVPTGETTFHDLVHGDITFDNAHIEDFVALRSDGHPTYHLSVVADDIDMAITHVVRGDDHISNTPKQVLLYRAFGKPLPAFAHVPLILGPDKRRLSKRHGATSVTEYSRQGYLPEAMMNFLALLGWSPGNDQELFSRDELVAAFSLEGISSSDAVFNPEKLEWFSAQHIARMPAAELVRRIEPRLREAGLWPVKWSPGSSFDSHVDASLAQDRLDPGAWLARLIELLRPRAKRLTDFVEKGRPFLVDEVEYDADAVKKHLSSPEALAHLAAVRDTCAASEAFTAAALEPAIRALADARGVKAGVLIHPTRVAVVGRAESPGIFEVLELLGRERALDRMTRALQAVRPQG
ncbi:MAG: glutamate--tRNA ligase [Vicinamibacterales bacterium]|jgi:glutamyl-tRNA synthetase|nr:glutamate--tRNA ligase [Vicinamibacterales bacterium]